MLTLEDITFHWDEVYDQADITRLGWYEEAPEPSLSLIQACSLSPHARILNVGAGASTLVDELLKLGYQNIIVNDISARALKKLKDRLGANKGKVHWVTDDLIHPLKLNNLDQVDLWHDRAVLHFFTEIEEQDTYFALLKKLVKSGGFVILATFNLDGATKCSGLAVNRYDKNMLQDKLGSEFKLVQAFDHLYTMPSGDYRDYVYTLFQRC